jgi:uncharacterized DUF497 family protein
MIDLDRIVGFDWDAGNARKSVDRHSVNGTEAEEIFFNDPLILADDIVHSATERRFHALGTSDGGRRLHVTFTLRVGGTLTRVISARDMSRKERHHYDQKGQVGSAVRH